MRLIVALINCSGRVIVCLSMKTIFPINPCFSAIDKASDGCRCSYQSFQCKKHYVYVTHLYLKAENRTLTLSNTNMDRPNLTGKSVCFDVFMYDWSAHCCPSRIWWEGAGQQGVDMAAPGTHPPEPRLAWFSPSTTRGTLHQLERDTHMSWWGVS